MPTLSWITGRIAIDDHDSRPTEAALVDISKSPELLVSVVHEYVHFMQLVSSVGGVRLLADFVDLGVRGGLLLSGSIKLGEVVSGYKKIMPLLKDLRDSCWSSHEGVAARRVETMDELDAMFTADPFAYSGQKTSWEVESHEIALKTYVEPMWGFVVSTPLGPKFRPFSIGFLAENMARRLDRWFASGAAPKHTWPASPTESEYYNGLFTLLERRLPDSSAPTIEEIVVVIASLALASPRPDLATALMLERVILPVDGGHLTENVAATFKSLLVQHRLLHADHYNEAISDVMWGAAQIMDRTEYAEIHGRLLQIHGAANRILTNPTYFVEPKLNWETVKRWMKIFPPPPVVVVDGLATKIGEVSCESFATDFLSHVERALLRDKPEN